MKMIYPIITGLLMIIAISMILSIIFESNKFEKRTILEVKENKGIPAQLVSFEYNYPKSVIDIEIKDKYTGECEKEVLNKFSSNEKSIACTKDFLKKLEKPQTFKKVKDLREELLLCVKKVDDNMYGPLFYNIRGLDLLLYDSITYGMQCKENRELMNEMFIINIKILIPLFIFFISFIIYMMTHKGIFIWIGSGIIVIYIGWLFL